MKTNRSSAPKVVAAPSDPFASYRILLWLAVFVNSLFLIPNCLDRYLAPRFLFLSVALLGGLWLLRRDLLKRGNWRLHSFDLLLILWYGLNLASVAWAFSWSEAVFFSQKVLLLLLSYVFFSQCLHIDESATRKILARITQALTFSVSAILLVQLAYATTQYGLDNDALYDYASGVFGNKGLAADFLFFLLIFNLLFYREISNKRLFWFGITLLLLLILVLQTRTVYLAVAAGALVYFPLRAIAEPGFRPVFLKKILPAGVILLGLLIAFVSLKGCGDSLSERLNPLTYLESASANERRFVWYKTDQLNKENVWLGVGNGSWKFWFPSKGIQGGYRLEEKNIVFTRAHNDYLEIRAELGVVGVVVFIGLFVLALGAALAVLFRRPPPESAARLAALTAGLLGYCVIQYFDFPRERIEMQVILALLLALTVGETRALWASGPGIGVQKQANWLFLLAGAGLLFNLVIGFYRVKGEIHNVRLMQAMVSGNIRQIIAESRAASNPFYEYNDTALPLQWFEGVAEIQQKRPAQAIEALREAYRLNPWSFQVLNNYASALAMNKQFREALPVYEQVLSINPRYDEGKLNLAYTWLQLGDTLKARDWGSRIDTIPNPQSEEDRAKNKFILKQQAELFRYLNAR